MIPLERYMASLMPLQKNLSPYKGTPLLKPFNPDDFIATLDTAGPQLTTGIKGEWAELYRKFFRSRNFHGWYQTRHREVGGQEVEIHEDAGTIKNSSNDDVDWEVIQPNSWLEKQIWIGKLEKGQRKIRLLVARADKLDVGVLDFAESFLVLGFYVLWFIS